MHKDWEEMQPTKAGTLIKALAANQGLYNAFLGAGSLWGVFHPNQTLGYQIQLFFTACVVVAAIFGAMTVSRKIIITQGAPAILALLSLLLL